MCGGEGGLEGAEGGSMFVCEVESMWEEKRGICACVCACMCV